jgi:hypothetical protein
MDETVNEPQKTAVIKTLAIIGFIVALILVAWLAVQAVRLVPTAFTTLASIAHGLKQQEPTEFTIATGTNIINAGETLTISWTKPSEKGAYVFSYKCTEGVGAEIRDSAGELSSIGCDSEISLADDTQSVAIIFSSEKSRFVDIAYTIGFTLDGTEVAEKREGLITVVNPGISSHNVVSNTDGTVETNTTGMPMNTSTSTDNGLSTPNVRASTTQSAATSTQPTILYKTVPVVVTTMPVSNPNGQSDLAVTFIGVGTYNTTTKNFSPQSSLKRDERAALRFEVKNIGTKTSERWSFMASLPTDPTFIYRSPVETALKPNERQVVTLQFTTTNKDTNARIAVTAMGGNDLITGNNLFLKQISVSN